VNAVWFFGAGVAAGPVPGPDKVGSKAWHLMRLAEAGLPVPTGFVLGTAWCRAYREAGRLPEGFREQLAEQVRVLESVTGRALGGRRRPLLVSVRSGAPASMPGMLDTILDVGIGDALAAPMRRDTGNPRLYWDCYRRFVQSFGETVWQVPAGRFEGLLRARLAEEGAADERELDAAALASLTRASLAAVEEACGTPLPQDPLDQLSASVEAVFRSWDSPRATAYRRLAGLDDASGTAAIVQMMVFGNAGAGSGSGVGFTRNPATGEPGLYVDFLEDAQGEDVVSGRRSSFGAAALARRLPAVHRELETVAAVLERLFRDAQDFEFTVERGALWLLQSRPAKRTPLAALRIAADHVREGLLTRAEGRARVAGLDLGAIVEERAVAPPGVAPLARGTPAGPGVASGPVALDAEGALASPEPAILVRPDTCTSDLAGMHAAAGVLTAIGSRTSHAAVVARQLGRPCIVGCTSLRLDLARRRLRLGDTELAEGDVLTLDGTTGEVWPGRLAVERWRPAALLDEVRSWAGDEACQPA